jgi:hypothetical protein
MGVEKQLRELRAEVERMKAAALAKDPMSGQYREYDELVAERDRLREALISIEYAMVSWCPPSVVDVRRSIPILLDIARAALEGR